MKEKIMDIFYQSMLCLSEREPINKLLISECSNLHYLIISELTLQMDISQTELPPKLIRHCAFLAYQLLTEKEESFVLEEEVINLIIKKIG